MSIHKRNGTVGPAVLVCTLLLFFEMPATAFCQGTGLFDFSPDVRLFTSYAMMNAAGRAGEWHNAGMDSVRSRIRLYLAGRLDTTFQRQLKAFNVSHGRILETYELALLTSGPPYFRLDYNSRSTEIAGESLGADTALSQLLAEFYRKADIGRLWEEYYPVLAAGNDRYEPFADSAIRDVEAYCSLDSDYFSNGSRKIHFEVLPLLPYFTSLTARVNGELYITSGPQLEKPDRSVFYYYLLNRVTMPLVKSDTADVERLAGLFDSVKARIDLKRGRWDILVAQSFAEAMDIRLEKTLYGIDSAGVEQALATEYKFGFILCPVVYENLDDYEKSRMSFSDFFRVIMGRIDYGVESERWNRFWSEK